MDNNEKTVPEPQATEASEPDLIPESITTQWKSWALQVGVVAVVLLAVFAYRAHKQGNEDRACRMLGEARNVQSLQAIITQYPNTSAAPLARLQAAKALCDAGDYAGALSAYTDFLTKYPKHPLKEMAELGKIQCREAMGQLPEALSAYSAHIAAYPDSFLLPLALFGKARCLEQLKRYGEARVVYEDFLAAHPKTPWKADVEDNLRQLDRETRKSTPAP